MTAHNHLGPSADSTAAPVTFLVAAVGALVAYFLGLPVFSFLVSLLAAWGLGHISLFALIYILEKLGFDGPK